ncbi:MAG: ATP-binding protein [Chloroflexi bacterium]|nr:ATP-binding protein [Chloroflexota bacterium]
MQSETFRVPAHIDTVRKVTRIAAEYAASAGLSEDAVFECRLAVDEACMNIIEHAYDFDESAVIEVHLEAHHGEWHMHLTDFGEAYDPDTVDMRPLRSRDINQLQPGGLGLYLMHRVMDEVHYTASPHGNRLVMVKRR